MESTLLIVCLALSGAQVDVTFVPSLHQSYDVHSRCLFWLDWNLEGDDDSTEGSAVQVDSGRVFSVPLLRHGPYVAVTYSTDVHSGLRE
ncbi:hypothetical protein BJ912DRAFT_38387 [Pholiota molesta]|nr:hypothetical protein BJ912DRAFT_38387 [Pholiota molesta]